jgi:hypothetical protein
MFVRARSHKGAAAALAAVLCILAAACGGGDDDDRRPAPRTPADGPPAAGATATPAPGPRLPGGGLIDLARHEPLARLLGEEGADLVTGAPSLAAGDFNGDGAADLLIGAPQADGPGNSRPDAGEAYIIFGPLGGERDLGAGRADVAIFGATSGDSLGYAVRAADVNGDGYDDVIAGAPGVTAGFDPRTDQGRVYVFFGGADFGREGRLDLAADVYDFTVTGAEGFSRLGHAVAAGDVNGDGTNDLVLGAPFAGRPAGAPPGAERTSLGEVYVVYGSEELNGEVNVARPEYDVLIGGAEPFAQFGASLAVADVNGDGTGDIIVGAYRTAAPSGAVYVFFGGARLPQTMTVPDGDADATITGPADPAALGLPLAAGDFNGDGLADIAIGAQLRGSGLLDNQGAVYVVAGSRRLSGEVAAEEAAAFTAAGSMGGALMPSALALADLDEDGKEDLVIGCMLADAAGDRPGSGVLFIVAGREQEGESMDLSREEPSLKITGAEPDDRLGAALAVGELSGRTSLIVLAANADAGDNREAAGVVYVVAVE